MKTVAAVFPTLESGTGAMRALEAIGIPSDGIHVIAGNEKGRRDAAWRGQRLRKRERARRRLLALPSVAGSGSWLV